MNDWTLIVLVGLSAGLSSAVSTWAVMKVMLRRVAAEEPEEPEAAVMDWPEVPDQIPEPTWEPVMVGERWTGKMVHPEAVEVTFEGGGPTDGETLRTSASIVQGWHQPIDEDYQGPIGPYWYRVHKADAVAVFGGWGMP